MVTTRERPERLRRAIAAGTAGRWTEELVWGVDLFVPPSQPGTSSDAWTLSSEPQKETPVFDPVEPNPSAATFVYRLASPLVQYFLSVQTAGTYTPAISSESPIQPAYLVPADIIAGRSVEERAREVIAQQGLERLVQEMAKLVDSNLKPRTYRGGSVMYQQSLENPADREVVVVTKLAISRQERFDLSLKIGETLSQLVASSPYDGNWMHVTFSLELA